MAFFTQHEQFSVAQSKNSVKPVITVKVVTVVHAPSQRNDESSERTPEKRVKKPGLFFTVYRRDS